MGRTNYILITTDQRAFDYLTCRGFNAWNDAQYFKNTILTEATFGALPPS